MDYTSSNPPYSIHISNMKQSSIICPYCGKNAELVTGSTVYPHRPDLVERQFWYCGQCAAYVGCHIGTTNPLGSLANAELRALRMDAHELFDPLWKNGTQSRRHAYKWLAEQLNIPYAECHISWFNEEQCLAAIALLRRYTSERRSA